MIFFQAWSFVHRQRAAGDGSGSIFKRNFEGTSIDRAACPMHDGFL